MNTAVLSHFEKNDPILFAIALQVEPFTLSPSQDYFLELADHITSQQLSLAAGNTIFNRLLDLFPQRKMTPEALLLHTDEKLRHTGLSRTKVVYMKDLAQKIVHKKIPFEKFDSMSDEEVIKELITIKGIGVWTAEMFLMTSLAREDVFSYGDLGIRRAIQRLYKLENEPTREEAEDIAKKWSPYRTYACKILWRSLKL
jgi:DNA-3-methyladenine glycosylase II